VAAAVYANALANGLVWDDPIVLTRQLAAFHSLRDLLIFPRDIPQFSPDYYRPLTILSYLLDRAIGGVSPLVFHLSVIVYHVLATYLVFRLGLLVLAGTPVMVLGAGLGAAAFAVHPMHTESVAWGAGRSDVIACVLVIAAVLVYRGEGLRPTGRAIAAAALSFLAMLAKETAVAVVAILPATDLLLGRRPVSRPGTAGRAERRRRSDGAMAHNMLLGYVPLLVALVGYIGLRRIVLGSTFGPATDSGSDTIARMAAAVGVYVGKLILPIHQSAYISDLPTSPISLAGATLLIGLALVVAVAGWQRHERRVTFLLMWIGVALAPSLAIVVKIPAAPIAERYLYIPSVGFCVLLGYAAAHAIHAASARLRLAVIAAVTAVLAAGVVATVRRNAVWRSNLSLWEDTAAKNATDGLPMRSLATAYQETGDTLRATEYFRKALQRRNDLSGQFIIDNNLGTLALQHHQLAEAEQYYRAALAVNAQSSESRFNLGLIGLMRANGEDGAHDSAWRRQQAEQARQWLEQATRLNPHDPDIAIGLGQVLAVLDDRGGARSQYERALALGVPADLEASVRKLMADLE
jgi:protein O-mannosyl-transferase